MDMRWSMSFLGILMSYCLLGIHGAPNLGSFESAEPPSALKVHSNIVCEGQKAYIKCESIFDQIEIMGTMYGRKDKSTCVHPSIPSEKQCQEQETQVIAHVRGLCDGERKCEVAANNQFLAKAGTTICPEVYKYLDIKYKCVPRTSYSNVDGGSENGQTVSEVITTNGAGLSSSSVTSSTSTSTYSSVPEITVQEHVSTEPVTTATSQGSVTPIDTHKDVTEEFTQSEGTSDVISETFPSNAGTSSPEEVNETYKKSETPPRPDEVEDGLEEGEEEKSGSGELDGFDEEPDDALYRR